MNNFNQQTLILNETEQKPVQVCSNGNYKIILNKDRFIEIMAELITLDENSSIKRKVEEIKNVLLTRKDDLFILNISENGGTVEYQKNILLNDLQQIIESKSIERAKYYLERLKKGIEEIKTSKINDLNLNRWKEYEDVVTDSLWNFDKRDKSGVHIASYWGNFIPQIPNQTLMRYTKKGD